MRNYSHKKFKEEVFLEQVSKIASNKTIQQWKLLTTEVIQRDNLPQNRKYTTDFRLPENYLQNVVLAIASWYIGDLGWVLRESIREKYFEIERLRGKDITLLRIILSSKAESEIFLLETNLWNTNEFFGLYNKKKLNYLFEKIVSWKLKPVARKVQRKRSSDDKSTASHSIIAGFYDRRFGDYTREHYLEELRQEQIVTTVDFAIDWLR